MFELPVWEICKFWILQNCVYKSTTIILFERYVNFEFYKTTMNLEKWNSWFERYVNFEFYKTFVTV